VNPELHQETPRPRPRRQKRGVALVIVIASVTILSVFAAEFAFNTRVYFYMANNTRERIQAYYNARSATRISLLVIDSFDLIKSVMGGMPGTKLAGNNLELWRFACKFAEVFSHGKLDLMGFEVLDMKEVEGVGGVGNFGCEITPEDGRVNISRVMSIQEKQTVFKELYAIFRNHYRDTMDDEIDRDLAEAVARVIDWADPDQNQTVLDPTGLTVTEGGAEDDNYGEFGYEIKNAKFDSLPELHLVEGIEDDMYCKFADKLTVYDTFKLNVNTADIEVIKALLCEFMMGQTRDMQCGLVNPGLITPIDIVGGYIETCRRIKMAMFMLPFPSPNHFVRLLQRLPDPLNKEIVVNSAALTKFIDSKSKILRIRSWGQYGRTEARLESVYDTSRHNFVYWREY
jgi:type II secretory pathway component PulK